MPCPIIHNIIICKYSGIKQVWLSYVTEVGVGATTGAQILCCVCNKKITQTRLGRKVCAGVRFSVVSCMWATDWLAPFVFFVCVV